MQVNQIFQIVVPIIMLIYSGFCWVKQGSHVRGRGWMTREEAPKTFWFSIFFYSIVGFAMLVVNYFFNF